MGTNQHAETPPVRRFAAELRRLRISAGEPQVKTIAARAQCSPATVSEVLNGHRLASETVTRRLVDALGGDWAHWGGLWRAAKTELDELRRDTPDASREPGAFGTGPDLSEAFRSTSRTEMVCYPSPPAFYKAAADHIRAARSEIRLTYVRLHPPTQWGSTEPASYYATVLQWARDNSAECASVRRIIGVPERKGVPKATYFEWLRQHQEEVKDLYTYEARVMPWSASCAWYNMGLIDDTVTFLSFSGAGRRQLTGFSVDNPQFLAYFADSFDQAWGALEPLDAYVTRHSTPTPHPTGPPPPEARRPGPTAPDPPPHKGH
ncbi:helix-turn-helix domain-containing protein [Streptomyces sp. NBC_00015]|uniref:helix-turn-helix domain-containing protein n=1 Tax=unclassified Streptomyces TaxID=2593676 RepID=UPI0022578163|nr:helix-turn-helix transcriptional regulator [Streptomyces sp. NBC_00103]MCX5367974.1 helix-turn-helix domain-containing protein [Streptomyces sp. NBC_00103]